ncbi:EutN/CcmL family microcompartment protein [Haliangium sp.]|uniref:EutN/CcmL family microcompartment protein n=1 Tax=Haliangium sp. TaxID=2663208 RepID=UPI003D106B59
MRLCRVIGNVVSTVKHPVYHGRKLMIVQPVDPGPDDLDADSVAAGHDRGASFLAVDQAQAGPGDLVVVLTEGTGVRQILDVGAQVPIRSLIVGIVDQVEGPPRDRDATPGGDATEERG